MARRDPRREQFWHRARAPLGHHRRYLTGAIALAPAPRASRNRRVETKRPPHARARPVLHMVFALLVVAPTSNVLVDSHQQQAQAAVARVPTASAVHSQFPKALAAGPLGLWSPQEALDRFLRRPPPLSNSVSSGRQQARRAARGLCGSARTRVSCPYPGQRTDTEVFFTADRRWLCAQLCVEDAGDAVEPTREGPFRAWYLHGGRVAVRGTFRAGRPHGLWRFYQLDGTPRLRGRFVAGHAHGTWRTWNAHGLELPRSDWRRGLRLR